MAYLNVFLNLMYTFDLFGKAAKVASVCSGAFCGVIKVLCVTKLIGIIYFIGSIWGAEMQAVYHILIATLK